MSTNLTKTLSFAYQILLCQLFYTPSLSSSDVCGLFVFLVFVVLVLFFCSYMHAYIYCHIVVELGTFHS